MIEIMDVAVLTKRLRRGVTESGRWHPGCSGKVVNAMSVRATFAITQTAGLGILVQ